MQNQNAKKILVTGACGYIGSHTVVDLINYGYEVIGIDNFVNSDDSCLDGIEEITGVRVKNYDVNLCDLAATKAVFAENPDIEGVIHFAALKSVPESVQQPLRYYHNNTESLINLIEAMDSYNVRNLIFSSSCSVYGNAEELPVTENTPMKEAQSPYARTKQIGEDLLRDLGQTKSKIRSILLRYFNPAGAHPSGLIGESPRNSATSLVPVITETAIGKRESMMVYGEDYDTRDGSCVRDFIHVMDLANAHTKALEYLFSNEEIPPAEIFNLGIGSGVTVLEAIHAFEKVSGQRLNYKIGPRRDGDVIAIYANPAKAISKLGWTPTFTIEEIMRSAWSWQMRTSGL